MTLMEVMTVVAINGILVSIAAPSMVTYVNRVKEQKYIIEAQSVRRSIELYLLENEMWDGVDMMDFLEFLSEEDLNSSKNVLSSYMKVRCSDDAYIQNLTLEEENGQVKELVYLVDGHMVEIIRGECVVTDLSKKAKR